MDTCGSKISVPALEGLPSISLTALDRESFSVGSTAFCSITTLEYRVSQMRGVSFELNKVLE